MHDHGKPDDGTGEAGVAQQIRVTQVLATASAWNGVPYQHYPTATPKLTVRAGEASGESVGAVHRGRTEDEAVDIVVTYAGAEGLPLSIPTP